MNKEQLILHIENTVRLIRELDQVVMTAAAARKILEAQEALEAARKLLLGQFHQ